MRIAITGNQMLQPGREKQASGLVDGLVDHVKFLFGGMIGISKVDLDRFDG